MDWLDLLNALSDTKLRRLPADQEPSITLDLRDEDCVRCGKPTRYSTPGEDGLPTCANCRSGLTRPRPQERRCPADGTELELHPVSNVAVDRCPTCGGVWLDAGELDLVTKAAARSAARSTQDAEDLLATVLAGLPLRRGPRSSR